jgi:hypothetical protein
MTGAIWNAYEGNGTDLKINLLYTDPRRELVLRAEYVPPGAVQLLPSVHYFVLSRGPASENFAPLSRWLPRPYDASDRWVQGLPMRLFPVGVAENLATLF